MSRNGSGVYSLNTAGQPVVAGTTITATAFNAATADIATALTQSICVDGQSVITGNIPMSGFKLTGLGAPNTAGDALRYTSSAANYALVVAGRPSFSAFRSATVTNQTGAGANPTVTFDTEVFDNGSNFASNTFTAPVTGIYRLSARVLVSALSVAMTAQQIAIVTTAKTYVASQDVLPLTNGSLYLSISELVSMTAADTALIKVQVSNGAGNSASFFGDATTAYTTFCGEMVS